jgi:hypothetical protein
MLKTRKAFVVRVGQQFIGPRHMHRALVSFEKAELFRYRAAAKRIAYAKRADEIMTVLITLEEPDES